MEESLGHQALLPKSVEKNYRMIVEIIRQDILLWHIHLELELCQKS